MRRRNLALALAALAGSFVAITCTRREAKNVAPAVAKRDVIHVQYSPTISFAPYAIAAEEGFFAAEGLDARLVQMDMRESVAGLVAGQLDVIAGPVRAGLFNTIAHGEPLQVVADKGRAQTGACAASALVARPAAAARLNRGDARGLRIALSLGDNMEYLFERFMDQRHLDRTAVKVNTTGGMAERLVELREGIVDMAFVSEPTLSKLHDDGVADAIGPIDQIEPGFQFVVIVYGRHFLRDRPDLGVRFMRAYLRGVKQYQMGKTDRNVAIVSRFTRLGEPEIRRACWPSIATDGRVNVESVEHVIQWSRTKGYLDSDVPVSAWWNPSFLEAASRPPAGASR